MEEDDTPKTFTKLGLIAEQLIWNLRNRRTGQGSAEAKDLAQRVVVSAAEKGSAGAETKQLQENANAKPDQITRTQKEQRVHGGPQRSVRKGSRTR